MVPVSVKFLGVKVTLQSREDFKEFLIQTIYENERFRVLLLDEKKLYQSFFDKEMRAIINHTEVVFCSSQTAAWAAKVLTGKEIPIIMPVTLFLDMMRAADEMNYTVFLYGGKKDINVETLKRIRKSFPTSRIVGNYRSDIKGAELEDVLIAIRKSSPQIFFANLGGSRKQEKWLTDKKSYIEQSVVVGVDNAFRVISGKKKMPPLWVQEKGWTGLHRFLSNPLNVARFFRLLVIFFVTLYRRIFKKEKPH